MELFPNVTFQLDRSTLQEYERNRDEDGLVSRTHQCPERAALLDDDRRFSHGGILKMCGLYANRQA